MDKIIYFAFNHFDTGGLQTLMIRMAEWSKRNDIKARIVYQTCDNRMACLALSKKIELNRVTNKKEFLTKFSYEIAKCDTATVFSFEIDDFLLIEKILTTIRKKKDVKHILYTVSVGGAIFSKKLPLFVNNRYKLIVRGIYRNKQLIFMDEDVWKATSNYYGLVSNNIWDDIFLLPMMVNNYFVSYDCLGNRQILTVTRAAFPYKGYVLGLIDDYVELYKSIDNIELKIIAVGPDYETLDKKVKQANKLCNNSIMIINGMTQDEINQELLRTYLYVGMGTTVLDAANNSVPAVVSVHDTLKNECVGYFHENPKMVSDSAPGVPALDFIKKLLEMSINEYNLLRKKTYFSFKDNYDIDKMMNRLLNRLEIISSHKMSCFDLNINQILHKIREIKNRGRNI